MRVGAFRIPIARSKILALVAVAVVVYLCASRGRPSDGSRASLLEPLFQESEAVAVIRSEKNQAQYIGRDGVHVVVGRYVGDSISSNDVNLTEAELNANNFHPVAGAGANGDPVFVPGPDEWKAKRLFHANKFNLMASDRIPLNRSLPDVRRAACVSRVYDEASLPKASVVIVFHNEAWSTLLRTVQSVVDRSWYSEVDGSKASLVREIILVDDASDRAFLRSPLDEHLSRLQVHAKVIRISQRVGLIKARLSGAEAAEGDVLVFLDAHCEVTVGWLQPLLARVKQDPTTFVCPIIDIISDDHFGYVKSFSLHWGAFNWEMHFRWFSMGQTALQEFRDDVTRPYRTPAMAGGLFAVDRAFFFDLGSYDDHMDIWGGENLELSFRAWLCGGAVEIAPCSRVGHVFRKASPYDFPRAGGVGAVLHVNLARVALVWMDEWAQFFFKVNPFASKASEGQDVQARLQLKKRLKCKNFAWYLKNVWPENFFPADDRKFGNIIHKQSGRCLQKNSGDKAGAATLMPCVDQFYVPQMMVLSERGSIMTDESMCLDAPTASAGEIDAAVRFGACSEGDRQKWMLSSNETSSFWGSPSSLTWIMHVTSNLCLSHPTSGTSDVLTLRRCQVASTEQKWIFKEHSWKT